MKIFTCYDNLAAQQWYYTNDKRFFSRSDKRQPAEFQRHSNPQVYGSQHQSGLDDLMTVLWELREGDVTVMYRFSGYR